MWKQSTSVWSIITRFTKIDSLLCFMAWWHHRTFFLLKCRRRQLYCQPTFYDQSSTTSKYLSFNSNKKALHVVRTTLRSMLWRKFFANGLFHSESYQLDCRIMRLHIIRLIVLDLHLVLIRIISHIPHDERLSLGRCGCAYNFTYYFLCIYNESLVYPKKPINFDSFDEKTLHRLVRIFQQIGPTDRWTASDDESFIWKIYKIIHNVINLSSK